MDCSKCYKPLRLTVSDAMEIPGWLSLCASQQAAIFLKMKPLLAAEARKARRAKRPEH
jgi:hypothetical protein